VVSVLDFGATREGLHYMVMEYVHGRPLDALIAAEGPLDGMRAAAIARQMAAGLAHAHARGLVHRDVKPANVIVVAHDDGELVKILDFGLASVLRPEEGAALTVEGTTLGTPRYMAPEQIGCSKVGPAADLYALGVTMYEMLAGRPPFEGASFAEKMQEGPPPLATKSGLERLVWSLLAPRPEDRPASGRDVVAAIDEVLAQRGVSMLPGSVVPRSSGRPLPAKVVQPKALAVADVRGDGDTLPASAPSGDRRATSEERTKPAIPVARLHGPQAPAAPAARAGLARAMAALGMVALVVALVWAMR
jgi:serine/threonine-protein kinase